MNYRELQKAQTDRQLSEIRKTIHEQNEQFHKEIKIIKKNLTEILELKNTMSKMNKNAIENVNSRFDQTEQYLNLKTGH